MLMRNGKQRVLLHNIQYLANVIKIKWCYNNVFINQIDDQQKISEQQFYHL